MQLNSLNTYCIEAGIELLVLFGSSASGETRPGSDIDLAVKMARGRATAKLDLIYRLGELMGDREVDLVVLSADTDPVLQFEIFSAGKMLFEGHPGSFAEERVRACRHYYDTAKLRRSRSDYLKSYAKRTSNVA